MFKTLFGLLFWLLVYAGGAYAALTFWYLPKYTTQATALPSQPPRIQAVRVVIAERSDHTIVRSLQARVVARKQGGLYFHTDGCVEEVYGDPQPGDMLEKGQILGKLSDAHAKLRVVEGMAKVVQFNARVTEAEVGVNIKVVVSNRAERLLAEEMVRYERQKTLFAKELSTQKSLEMAERALQSAEEIRNVSAEAKVLSEAQLSRLKTELLVIEVQLEQARLNLADLTLRAPRTARVLKNNIRLGDCVSPTTPVFDIYDPESLEINAEIPTLLRTKVAKDITLVGAQVTLLVPFDGCASYISGIEPVIGSPNAQVLRIPLPQQCAKKITFNQGLSLTIPILQLPEVIRLPKAAERQPNTLFVVVDDHLSSRDVKITTSDENWVYVTEGLEAGDQVLVSATGLAVQGLAVKVVTP